jgi:uncharacterized protein (TIGR02231 family)
MKNVLLALVLFLPFLSFSQTSVSSDITDVTVFLSRAQVTRTANVSVASGEQSFKITDLTQALDPNSIQVKGNENFTILSVKHQVNYLEDKSVSPEIKEKQDSLEELEFKVSMRRSLRNVYTEEKAMILANKEIKGKDGVLLAEDLQEISDFYRKRLTDIEYKLLDIQIEEKELNEDITRLRNHLNQLRSRRSVASSDILVTVLGNKSARTNMEVSYMVNNAGWHPVYDIRAEDVNNPVQLTYKGRVYQGTGNDWDDVMLTLSTGNPAVGGQAPELGKWYLYLQEVYDRKAKAANMYGRDKAPQADSYDMEGDSDMAFYASAADLTSVVQNTITTEFKIAAPYSIPSDNQYYEVETKRISLPASFEHFAIPKLDKDAFLLAQVTDWQQHNLLPGESNVYFKGTFVGNAFIDPAIAEDTLALSLGRDKSIVIKRDRIEDMCKTKSLGSKKTTTKAYRITVHNTKSVAIDLVLEDQIPLTSTNEIEITVDEMSGAKYDAESGKLTWDMDLGAGKKREVVLKFTVKYPKKKVISNL